MNTPGSDNLFNFIVTKSNWNAGLWDQSHWQSLSGGGYASGDQMIQAMGNGAGQATRPSQPYSQVVAVYACVRMKAIAFAQLPLRISTNDDQVVETGNLARLVAEPDGKLSAEKFWRDSSALVDIFGKVHWYIIKSGNRILSYNVINPLQMKPKIDRRSGKQVAWLFYPTKSSRHDPVEFSLDEIHTVYDPHYHDPFNSFAALSPAHVCAQAIAQYFKADLANEASLDNGVEPSGILKSEQTLDSEQKRDIREQVAEKHQGVLNRKKFLLLEGGMSWERMQSAFAEMEFSELKKMSREDICVAFGVPPLVAGYSGEGSLGSGKESESAERMFWFHTIMPRASWFADEFNIAIVDVASEDRSLKSGNHVTTKATRLQQHYQPFRSMRSKALATNRKYWAWFDASGVGAVQRAALELSEMAREWVGSGVPLNQVISAYDVPFEEVPWGNTWYKPIGVVDVQAADVLDDEPTGPPAPPEGPADGDTPDSPEDEDDDGEEDEADEAGKSLSKKSGVEQLLTKSARAVLWEQWRRSWTPLENQMQSAVRKHWRDLRKIALRNAEANVARIESQQKKHLAESNLETKAALQTKSAITIATLLFDLKLANEKLLVRTRPLIRHAFELGGKQAMTEAAGAEGRPPEEMDPFNIADPNVARALQKREIDITSINRTLQKELRKSMAEWLDEGEPIGKIAERIRKRFNVANARARTIAMTETGGAVEAARQEGRSQAKVPAKAWLWSRKETGRDWHFATENKTMTKPVANHKSFVIEKTGRRAMHPRGSGAAEDDINCGCTTIARYPDDQVKELRALHHLVTKGFVTADQLETKSRRTSSGKNSRKKAGDSDA